MCPLLILDAEEEEEREQSIGGSGTVEVRIGTRDAIREAPPAGLFFCARIFSASCRILLLVGCIFETEEARSGVSFCCGPDVVDEPDDALRLSVLCCFKSILVFFFFSFSGT